MKEKIIKVVVISSYETQCIVEEIDFSQAPPVKKELQEEDYDEFNIRTDLSIDALIRCQSYHQQLTKQHPGCRIDMKKTIGIFDTGNFYHEWTLIVFKPILNTLP